LDKPASKKWCNELLTLPSEYLMANLTKSGDGYLIFTTLRYLTAKKGINITSLSPDSTQKPS
jgi:hypothetical protein